MSKNTMKKLVVCLFLSVVLNSFYGSLFAQNLPQPGNVAVQPLQVVRPSTVVVYRC